MDYRTAWDARSASPLGRHLLPHWCVFWVTRWARTSQLRWNLPQITVVEVSGERKHLLYVKDVSMNNCGGLKMRKVQPKHVIQHENLEKPDRCIVRVFEEYSRRCPPNQPVSSFYLKPLVKPKGDIWYAAVPVGHNTLDKTVARMCSAAGIIGFKTNHSLLVTLATQLFQEGVDEQLIMAKTGHRSTDGVRSYKRVSKEQMELISNVVQGGSLEKKPKLQSTTEDANKHVKPPMDKENVLLCFFVIVTSLLTWKIVILYIHVCTCTDCSF